ncbi:divergent polysaccharide deacetylase family protein [Maricaulis sp.]|uniref:divergent polysaccharide deacetylase family protein n=1 Tax=Maricaulis sp. TaxID=1486257 RepID=UPI003A93231D
MPSRSVKSIRPRNAAMPALAGAVVASAYLAAAVAFSIGSAASPAPDHSIRFTASAGPAAEALPAAASQPGGQVSAAIPVLDSLPAASAIGTAEVTLPVPAPVTGAAIAARPRIALIIDDVGLDEAAAARVLGLDAPLTIAILPYADAAAATARAAEARGRDVLVHVPMEPLGLDDPGPHALRVDLSDRELRARIRWAMARVPGAIGLNNHMGSRFTGDPRAMRVALSAIAEQAPLFIDSMTIADSRGYAVAEGLGLPVLRRDIFLDHVIEGEAIRARLAEAELLARSQGHAVLIGHPHAATLEALENWIGEAREAGFDFVTVTTLSAQLAREPAGQISASIAP